MLTSREAQIGAIFAVILIGATVRSCIGHCAEATTTERALSALCGPGREHLAPHVDEAHRQYAIPPRLLVALMWYESRCKENAKSSKGAVCLMQLLGPARNGLRGKALLNPRNCILAGARWLAIRIRKCGTVEGGLGSYNTGQCSRGRGFARAVLAVAER